MISFNNDIFGKAKILIQDVAGYIPPNEASRIMSDIDTYKRNMHIAFERLVTSGIQHDGSYKVYEYLMGILNLLYCELENEFIVGVEPEDRLPTNREHVRLLDLEW